MRPSVTFSLVFLLLIEFMSTDAQMEQGIQDKLPPPVPQGDAKIQEELLRRKEKQRQINELIVAEAKRKAEFVAAIKEAKQKRLVEKRAEAAKIKANLLKNKTNKTNRNMTVSSRGMSATARSTQDIMPSGGMPVTTQSIQDSVPSQGMPATTHSTQNVSSNGMLATPQPVEDDWSGGMLATPQTANFDGSEGLPVTTQTARDRVSTTTKQTENVWSPPSSGVWPPPPDAWSRFEEGNPTSVTSRSTSATNIGSSVQSEGLKQQSFLSDLLSNIRKSLFKTT